LRAQGFEPGGNPPRGLILQVEPLGAKPNGKMRYGRRWVADPVLAPRIAEAFAMRAHGAGYTAIMRGPLAGVYKSASCLPTFFENRRYVTAGIVDQATFDMVQAMRLRHARKEGDAHPRRVASTRLLSGLLVCRCGSPMAGTTANSKGHQYRYYDCCRQMNRRDGACDQPRVRADELDEAVLDAVLAFLDGPGLDTFTQAVNRELAGDDGQAEAMEAVRQEMAAVEAAIGRLVDAVEDGGYAAVKERLKQKEAERRRLQGDLLLLESEAAARQALQVTAEDVAGLLGELRQARDVEDNRELRGTLKLLIRKVVVDGAAYRIEYRPEVRALFGEGGLTT
jgi:hypothetical protein